MKTIDMVGMKFGNLEVLDVAEPNRHGQGKLRCLCVCGKEWDALAYEISIGNIVSCGCKRDARNAAGNVNRTHSRSKTREYKTWSHMRERCYKPEHPNFENYGGRGISVCESWRISFESFFSDMGLAPSKAHTIDRINNDGNYEASNCRWSTRREQALNRRRTMWYTHDGITLCRKDWAKKLGINVDSIACRIKKGMDFSKIVEHFQSQVTNQVKELA